MMKIELGEVKAHFAYGFSAQGSVLAQTVQAKADKIEIHYDIQCDAEPERVAGLIRNARNGCYVRQTINNPGLFIVNFNGEFLIQIKACLGLKTSADIDFLGAPQPGVRPGILMPEILGERRQFKDG